MSTLPGPPAASLQAALEQRPERRAIASRIEAARDREAAVAAMAKPQISVAGGFDEARPNPRIFPRVDEWNPSWDVSVNVSWSLWDGGRRRAEEAEAAAATRALAARSADFDRQLAFEVEQRRLDVDSAIAAIAAADVGIKRRAGGAACAWRALHGRRGHEHRRARRADRSAAGGAGSHARRVRGAPGTGAARSRDGPVMTASPAPAPAHAIEVRSLSRRFGDFVAVDNLSFTVERGEIFGFLGSNGAGKSTTIRMLCGLLRPTSGTALVDGIDVGREPEAVKQRIGYMSQRFSLYELLTVDQNIRFWGGVYGLAGSRIESRREFVIEMAGLRGRETTLARDLSGGWRQRLALGCAILHEPPILFLDEPTGGVDPLARRQFWRLIDDLSQAGVTVLVTTHYLDEAERCHRVALIHAGKLATIGTTREVKGVFAGRSIAEVRGSDPVRLMKVLDAMPSVQKTSLFGTAVHAVLDEPRLDAAKLTAALAAAGTAATSVAAVPPSLEDVFLDVVERAGRRQA